ncbi:hypothetical protein CATRI_02475 [Corynebacterium atrinae]|uniref:AMIN-like domain-containing (lipo)protein n=1 Tax=Corynebacterium atrinae TaxID=1336740 RepID=UPI0025B2990F|nr:hypothetical protein [Corynebacterium atrinae]WJY62600.1 hypothetical protein CATRI_02475 [Corynebacterium atrinae]
MTVLHRVFRVPLAALVCLGCVGLASCSTGQPTDPSGSSATPTDTLAAATMGTGSAPSADAGITPLGNADTTMKTLRPEAPSQLMVSGVRVGSHEGFDRVVFDLVGDGEPGWFIDYTTAPAQQGSGKPITFEGPIALNVNIDGTTYPFELGKEDPNIGTVAGSGNVTQVISEGTFEGRSQFIIGLNKKQPYSVQVLQDPHRLVIDIQP